MSATDLLGGPFAVAVGRPFQITTTVQLAATTDSHGDPDAGGNVKDVAGEVR